MIFSDLSSVHGSSPASPQRRLLVLYASQTGTAEDLALQLSDIFERLHFSVRVSPCDDHPRPSALLGYDLVLLVVSTTGQGDMPDNAHTLWRNLCKKKLASDCLSQLDFALFACGDSTYVKFCWAGRKMDRRLVQLGARQIVARGEGNHSAEEGIEGAFVAWTAAVKEEVLRRWPLPPGVEEVPAETLLPPKWALAFDDGAEEVDSGMRNGESVMKSLHAVRPGSLRATVKANTRVTAEDHWQDVRHLTFRLPKSVAWEPGDVLSLSPKNFPADVDAFLALQNWQSAADRPLKLVPPTHLAEIPPCPITNPVRPLTLRTLLTHHLDITAIPRRSFFTLAAGLTEDETHAERLREFADPQWVDELWDYTTRPRRSLLEVLQEFGSVKIGLDRLLEVVPRMRERQFSIASSPLGTSLAGPGTAEVNGEIAYPGEQQANGGTAEPGPPAGTEVDLLAAIVRYKTVIKKIRQGVCTRWLASLAPGDSIDILFERGTLAMKSEFLARPVVMVGPGTGVAPMRALLWHRVGLGATGENLLFFGCRSEAKDFFFAEEWKLLEERGLAQVWTAFSRDQKQKRYVQTVLREQSRDVWRALGEGNGVVYVCGSSGRMPQAVREALIEVFEKEGGWSREVGERYLMAMEKDGRYKQETWG